jgi:hypothetical protein
MAKKPTITGTGTVTKVYPAMAGVMVQISHKEPDGQGDGTLVVPASSFHDLPVAGQVVTLGFKLVRGRWDAWVLN